MAEDIREQIDEVRGLLEENLRYTKVIHEFTPKDAKSVESELVKLTHDNLEYTKANYAILEKIRTWLFWQKVTFYVKVVVIYIPIVVSIIFAYYYFPPLLKNAIGPYMELLKDVKEIPKIPNL